MPSTVEVERGQFGLVEAWIMENGAAFIRVSEACPARSQSFTGGVKTHAIPVE
jgi:hypothetical protein